MQLADDHDDTLTIVVFFFYFIQLNCFKLCRGFTSPLKVIKRPGGSVRPRISSGIQQNDVQIQSVGFRLKKMVRLLTGFTKLVIIFKKW